MDESWTRAKGVFSTLAGPPVVWLVAFFLVPLAIIWAYSFGENTGLVEIDINGTFANYVRALSRSTSASSQVGLVSRRSRRCCASSSAFRWRWRSPLPRERTKVWLLLLIMLPFWTNLLIRTYALIAVLRSEGYVNFGLEWLWNLGRALS